MKLCRLVSSFLLMSMVVASWSQTFRATVLADHTGNNWTYSLTNEEPALSPLKGGVLYVTLVAPEPLVGSWIGSIVSPPGWSYDTDFKSWIAWFVTDTAPAGALVDPGETQSGFTFTCTPPLGTIPVPSMQPC